MTSFMSAPKSARDVARTHAKAGPVRRWSVQENNAPGRNSPNRFLRRSANIPEKSPLGRIFNQRAIDRLMLDHKRGLLPDLSRDRFAATCEPLFKNRDRQCLVGATVAGDTCPT